MTKPDNWLAPYAEALHKRTGGAVAWGRLGKALKPLVEQHGDAEVLLSWRRYLVDTDAKFLSAEKFAQTYGVWSGEVAAKATPAQRTYLAAHGWLHAGDATDPFRVAVAKGVVQLARDTGKPLQAPEMDEYAEALAGVPVEAIERSYRQWGAKGSAFNPSPSQLWALCQPPTVEVRIEALELAEKVGNPWWYPKGKAFDDEVVRERLGKTAWLAFKSVDRYRLARTWDTDNPYHWVAIKTLRESYMDLVRNGEPRVAPDQLALTGGDHERRMLPKPNAS